MKPRIYKHNGYWYFAWPEFGGWTHRRCMIWSIAVEQMHRLYAEGRVRRVEA